MMHSFQAARNRPKKTGVSKSLLAVNYDSMECHILIVSAPAHGSTTTSIIQTEYLSSLSIDF
jgi:stage III sporulation protein SpoIIIAA